MKWITAKQLERWSDSVISRIELSEIVSSLVRASAPNRDAFRFPTGDSAQLPDYDGRLTAAGIPPYVPDGDSVWEFGTGADPRDKANNDFEKRTLEPKDIDVQKTTFVFVTSRAWDPRIQNIEQWRAEKLKKGKWKDIRVIDAVALEEWIENCAAVGSRLARELLEVLPATGVRSTDEFWNEYSLRFQPPLDKGVLLCDREEQAALITQQLTGPAQRYLWQADSPEEVIAFAVAAIKASSEPIRKFIEARTLVIDTEEAARQLAVSRNLAFLTRAGALRLGGSLAQRSPTIIPVGRVGPKRSSALLLPRPTSHSMAKALERMGLSETKAYQLARGCGRSVTILARHIASGTAERPAWDGQPSLIAALLAGSWHEGNVGDQEIVTALSGCASYDEFEQRMLPFLSMEDPPLEREGEVWNVRAPVDCFVHLAPLIGRSDFQRLENAFTAVFREVDPLLDMSAEDRFYAGVRGPKAKYTEWVRDGLATTLLLFGALHEEARLRVSGGAQAFVDRLIRNLPGLQDDHRLLASLEQQLPFLMEAAPNPLLGALERMLDGDGSKIKPIFADHEDHPLFSHSPHTGLLWGLEVLAWDPIYLNAVSLILGRLSRFDPGGKLSNRPLESLREIFLPWFPNTNANLVQRFAALDQLIASEPEVSWNLLLNLMPSSHGFAQPTAKPKYRDAGESDRELLTPELRSRGFVGVIRRALSLVGYEPSRWVEIIERLPNFDIENWEEAYAMLQTFAARASIQEKEQVWASLRKLVTRHRAFQNAAWAMKPAFLEKLEQLLPLLEPPDPLARIRWLFNEHYPQLEVNDPSGKLDAVNDAREAAVAELYRRNGISAVFELAAAVAHPRYVASAAVPVVNDPEKLDELIDKAFKAGSALEEFAIILSAEAARRLGPSWKDRVLARAERGLLKPDALANLILAWQDTPGTWDFAESLGEETARSYWKRKPVWPLREPHMAERAIEKYLQSGRALAAVEGIWAEPRSISSDLIVHILLSAIPEVNAAQNPTNMLTFEFERLLEELARRTDVSLDNVASIEYAYLPILEMRLLDGRGEGLRIHKLLSERPETFVSLLCDAFKPAGSREMEVTDEQRSAARRAYRVLASMRTVPGQKGDDIDLEVLRTWVSEVRSLAYDKDRAKIGDEYIGHMLAYAPPDSHGTWPHRAIRQLLEELKSDTVELGIKIERSNMRGVVQKEMYEGGKQERALAEKARSSAAATKEFPRTAALWRSMAKSWDADAEREDTRAKQDQMKFES